MVNINSNEPLFYPYSVLGNLFSGNCNDVIDPYAKLCLPGVVKGMNSEANNLLSKINETRHVTWHKTFACKCRLDASVCNNKQHWNSDK